MIATDFEESASGLMLPAVKPTATEPDEVPIVNRLHGAEADAEYVRVAKKLLASLLVRVDWFTCKPHSSIGGVRIPREFDPAVEEAARALKSAGIGWEEWT